MMMIFKKKALNCRGQAMVEAALAITFIVLLIFGMTEFGRAMYTKNSLTNAARAGVRQAVVTIGLVDCAQTQLIGGTCSSADNPVFDAINNTLVSGIDKSTVLVTVDISGKAPGATAATEDMVTVTVQANFTPVLKLFKPLIRSTLSGTATMRFER